MRARVDVTKHGRDLLPLQSVRRGDECERRDNYFAAHVQRADGNFESYRAIAHRDAMTYAEEFLDLSFEFLHKWTVV